MATGRALRCRECAEEYPLEARYVCDRCFGPLEVAYGERRLGDVAEARRRI
jgi:threonine synthase